MTFQAVVFNWRGHASRAETLERQLAPLTRVTVVNSDEALTETHRQWHHLGEAAYFSAQWQAALQLVDADVLFHIQADASCDDFGRLFARARDLFARYPLGVLEPNVDYTDFTYDTSRLRAIEEGLFEVPVTDVTCWFINVDVLKSLPPLDPARNKYGWGLAGTTAVLARLRGLRVLRDYTFTIQHPRGRGYPNAEAIKHRQAYFDTLPPSLARRVTAAYHACQTLRMTT